MAVKLVISFIAALLAAICIFLSSPLPRELSLTDGNTNTTVRVESSIFFKEDEQGNFYTLTGTIPAHVLTQRWVHITVDDCLEMLLVNGEKVPLASVPQSKLCDWDRGFHFPIGDYLRAGNNTVSFGIRNLNGRFSFRFHHSWLDPVFAMLSIVLLGALCFFVLTAMIGSGFPLVTAAIFMGGLLLRVLYLTQTDFELRSYDVLEGGGHFDYIKYIADNLSFPSPIAGWQYKHPPLYYMSAAPLVWLCRFFGLTPLPDLLQILSLIYFCGFLLAGLSVLARAIQAKSVLYLCSALLVFWPSGIIHSVRVGNDAAFYLVYTLALRSLLIWRKEQDHYGLLRAALWSGAAILIKSNAIALVPVLACAAFSVRRLPAKAAAISAAVILIALALNLGENIYYSFKDGGYDWLNSSVGGLNSALRVGNTPYHYCYFDVSEFLGKPFASTWTEGPGRELFWNFFLKSSLFGEFSFAGVQEHLALALAFLLLVQVIYFLCTLFTFTWDDLRERMVLLLSFAFLLAGILYFRIRSPFSPHADFRYAYPLLISYLAVLGAGLEKLMRSPRRFVWLCGMADVLAFVLCSIAFFLV